MIYHQLLSGIYGLMQIALMGNWKGVVKEQLKNYI